MPAGKKPRRVEPCAICRDQRTINLPRYERLRDEHFALPYDPTALTSKMQTFPCPACATLQDTDRLMTFSATIQLQQHLRGDAAYIRYTKTVAAEALMHRLIENGHIMFEKGPGRQEGTEEILAHVTLTGPASTPKLLDRIRQHQKDVAAAVINTAARMITDEDAMLSIVTFRQAFDRVMAQLKKEST